jgi:hypothetical protein
MHFHLMFHRPVVAEPERLWRDGVLSIDPRDGLDAGARDAIAGTLAACDPTLDRRVDGEDGSLSVVPSKGFGIDWHVDAGRVVAEPQVTGLRPALAEAAFARLIDCAAALRDRHGLAIWSPELGRAVDLDADHEALARAWLRHCDAAAKAHVEATRAGGNLSMIGALVMLGLLVGLAMTPAAIEPWLVVPVSVLLAVGLIYLIARRARPRPRRD